MERGSSVVERRTHNRESTGSSPLCYVTKIGHFRSLHWRPCWLSCINEYLAIDGGGNVSDLVLARNCCLARMLPGEAELVSEWTGLSGKAKTVKRFEQSNGLDTALYKNCLFFRWALLGHSWRHLWSMSKINVLSSEPEGHRCKVKEAIYIKQQGPTMNCDYTSCSPSTTRSFCQYLPQVTCQWCHQCMINAHKSGSKRRHSFKNFAQK